METLGLTRQIDNLGRIVIPREFRKALGIEFGDSFDIYATPNHKIILTQHKNVRCNGCTFAPQKEN